MNWLSASPAMVGITATAWIVPVRCLVTHMFSGNVRLVVPVIASSVSLCVYTAVSTLKACMV